MSFRIRLTHPAAPLAAAPSHARRGNSRCGAGLVRNLLRGMVCAVLARRYKRQTEKLAQEETRAAKA